MLIGMLKSSKYRCFIDNRLNKGEEEGGGGGGGEEEEKQE